jgi:hypothetical protein
MGKTALDEREGKRGYDDGRVRLTLASYLGASGRQKGALGSEPGGINTANFVCKGTSTTITNRLTNPRKHRMLAKTVLKQYWATIAEPEQAAPLLPRARPPSGSLLKRLCFLPQFDNLKIGDIKLLRIHVTRFGITSRRPIPPLMPVSSTCSPPACPLGSDIIISKQLPPRKQNVVPKVFSCGSSVF